MSLLLSHEQDHAGQSQSHSDCIGMAKTNIVPITTTIAVNTNNYLLTQDLGKILHLNLAALTLRLGFEMAFRGGDHLFERSTRGVPKQYKGFY